MVSSVSGNQLGSSSDPSSVGSSEEKRQNYKNGDSNISKVSSWADFFFKEFPVPIREFKALMGDIGPICEALGITAKVDALLGVVTDLNNFYTSLKAMAKHGYAVWAEEIGSVKFKYSLLSVTSKVLYLSICAFGATSIAGGAAGGAAVIVALFTLIIATHFYKKIYVEKIPEVKPKPKSLTLSQRIATYFYKKLCVN